MKYKCKIPNLVLSTVIIFTTFCQILSQICYIIIEIMQILDLIKVRSHFSLKSVFRTGGTAILLSGLQLCVRYQILKINLFCFVLFLFSFKMGSDNQGQKKKKGFFSKRLKRFKKKKVSYILEKISKSEGLSCQ